MPVARLARSALTGRASDVHWREKGIGFPVILLHGGWGAHYAWDDAMGALAAAGFRGIAPARSGYGASTPIEDLPTDFHARAADETFALLGAIGVREAALWGESDGAIIALLLALAHPERFPALVLEAPHLWRRKPASREFFERAAAGEFGVRERKEIVRAHARAWLAIAASSRAPQADFYAGRLGGLRARTLIVHGARDPRTEPGELDALRARLPAAEFLVLDEAGHSPRTERASSQIVLARVVEFLARAEKG